MSKWTVATKQVQMRRRSRLGKCNVRRKGRIVYIDFVRELGLQKGFTELEIIDGRSSRRRSR